MYLVYLEPHDQLLCSRRAFAVRPLFHPLAAEVCSHICTLYRRLGVQSVLEFDSHMNSYRKAIVEKLHI